MAWDIGAFEYVSASSPQDLTGATLGAGSALLAGVLDRNQIGLPVDDVIDGGWLAYVDGVSQGTNVNLMNFINDGAVVNDADTIRSGASPSNDIYTCAITSLATPGSGTVKLRVRARYL